MKQIAILVVVVLALSSQAFGGGVKFSVPAAPTVPDDVILHAIAQVETGNNPAARGSKGERSRFQILPSTWRLYSRMPHHVGARNPAEVKRVARALLAEIRSKLVSRGLPVTPYFIAAGWNAGPNWIRLRASTRDYAERVSNLVEDTIAATATPIEPSRPLFTFTPESLDIDVVSIVMPRFAAISP